MNEPPMQTHETLHEDSKQKPSVKGSISVSKHAKNNFPTGIYYHTESNLGFVSNSVSFVSTSKPNDPDQHSPPTRISSPISVTSSHPIPDAVHGHPKDSLCSHLSLKKREQSPGHKLETMARQKSRRSYDMNLVPPVPRNPNFLMIWRKIIMMESKNTPMGRSRSSFSLPSLVPCDGGQSSFDDFPGRCTSPTSTNKPIHGSSVSTPTSTHESIVTKRPCHRCLPLHELNQYTQSIVKSSPFGPNSESIIWMPSSRAEWEDSIDEMVAVCTASAWRRFRAKHESDGTLVKKIPPFNPPIQRIYVKDRIDIDDPLRGFQIRHKKGWLQGFVMTTTFTTWTRYFKWDMHDPKNGISGNEPKEKGILDDGTLCIELENQQRSGDPLAGGVVWPTVAEIGLVGALGCGEYLVQLALDDIARKGVYDYVVLDATDDARPFYEKFGFVRVGAVSKYGSEQDFANEGKGPEVVGYRHWTYANETTKRLDEHGAPSCMMARRITRRSKIRDTSCDGCDEKILRPSFLDQLSNFFVEDKPKIEPLGTIVKQRKRQHASSGTSHPTSSKEFKRPKRVTLSGRQSRAPPKLDIYSPNMTPTMTPQRYRRSNLCLPSMLSMRSPVSQAAPSNHSSIISKQQSLRKQKIANMYRDPKKVYYYNKVVTPKPEDKYPYKSKYYFVLDYQEDIQMIRLIPIFRAGTFKGKREGRDKWKARVLPRKACDDEKIYLKNMDVITATCSKWDIVPSFMVTKCSSVAEESWDILI